MLKKLLKYDFKAMFRLAIPFYIVVLAVALVGMGLGLLGTSIIGSSPDVGVFVTLIAVLALILYFLLYLVARRVATFLYRQVRFE